MDDDSPAEMIWIGSPPTAPLPMWRRIRPVYWVAIGAVVLVLATAGAWMGRSVAREDASAAAVKSPSASPRTPVFRVFGYFELGDDAGGAEFEWSNTTNTCWGRGGYGDIREGAPVVVTNADGRTVAVGELGPGKPNGSNGQAHSCTFAWDLYSVPDDGSAFYAVEVSHRGKVQRSRADITSRFDLGFS